MARRNCFTRSGLPLAGLAREVVSWSWMAVAGNSHGSTSHCVLASERALPTQSSPHPCRQRGHHSCHDFVADIPARGFAKSPRSTRSIVACSGLVVGDECPSICAVVLETAGGPHERDRHVGRLNSSFLFPQMLKPSNQDRGIGPESSSWAPHFVDYLFLAFNTSTAFSPTDTAVLSRWAKLGMMTQGLISLAIVVLLAARGVWIL
jgi:hypothetical protein